MLLRGLLIVAVAVPLACVAFNIPEPVAFPEIPPREPDLRRAYDQLGSQRNFDGFKHWCGLRVEPATRDESKLLDRALAATPDKSLVVPVTDKSRVRELLRQIDWVRINHPTDRTQWLGIGFTMNPGSDVEHTIIARVPMGFQVE